MEKIALKNGVIGGIIAIIINLVLWLIDPSTFIKYGSYVGLLILIVFMIKSARDFRLQNEGFLPFIDALKATFLTALVLSAITSLFQYVHYNFIDPNLIDLQKQIAVEAIQKMSGIIGEDGVNAAMEKLDSSEMNMGILQVVKGWLMGLIFNAIIALIISAIMKKNKPENIDFA